MGKKKRINFRPVKVDDLSASNDNTVNTSSNVSKSDSSISRNNDSNSTVECSDVSANSVQDTSADLSSSFNTKSGESGDSIVKESPQSVSTENRNAQSGKRGRNQNHSDNTKNKSGRNKTKNDAPQKTSRENKNERYDNYNTKPTKNAWHTDDSIEQEKPKVPFIDPSSNENWDDQTDSVTEEKSTENIKEASSDSWGDSQYTESRSNNSGNWDTTNTENEWADPLWDTENSAGNHNPASQYTHNQQDSVPNTTDNYFYNNFERPAMPKANKSKQKSDYDWRDKSNRSFNSTSRQSSNFPKRYSEGSNKDNWGSKSSAKPWNSRDSYDRSSDSKDVEYKAFYDEERKREKVDFVRVKEIQQDLFAMSKEYSLGHCVAEDMRMGSGIAVNFKREFKDVEVLLNQRQKQGGLAVLDEDNECGKRYVYYLVTKRESTGKPTYEKFWSSLQKMRNHIRENNVKKLAIPRLGCGLDRLEWNKVKHMIEFLFRDVEVEIVVCNFQQAEDSPEKPINYICKVVNVQKSVADIEEYTTIIYLTTQDGHKSPEMEQLEKKFSFLRDFTSARKQLGEVIKYEVPKKYFILYGCIVRKTKKDPFDFVSFRKCIGQINKNNRKDKYEYIGIQAIKDDDDDLLMEKILTILKNCLTNVEIYVCWDGELARQMPFAREP